MEEIITQDTIRGTQHQTPKHTTRNYIHITNITRHDTIRYDTIHNKHNYNMLPKHTTTMKHLAKLYTLKNNTVR